jgi:Polyketide cyclase / dehydrase and lipid transport
MARYEASLHTRTATGDVFSYLSDFSNSQEWDPGVVTAERVTAGAVVEGAEFRLVTRFLGSQSALTYRIVEYDSPRVVTFHGENEAVISHDRITFVSESDGTTIHYDARLQLKGYRKLMAPLVAFAFRRVGERGLNGLRRTLSERAVAGAQRTAGT